MAKPIIVCYVFESDSSPGTEYQALQYADGSTSCDCKGWTRRVAPDGSRSCKHTRLIDCGMAQRRAKATTDYRQHRSMPVAPAPGRAAHNFTQVKQGRFVDLETETA